MFSKITRLEILNLPPHWGETKWKVWDTIDLEWWKNLLLVWWNGTGKSTMLQILHDSVKRSRRILNWENTLLMHKHPYDVFSWHFDGYTWKINPYWHEREKNYTEENYRNDLLTWFTYGLEWIYWGWILNLWDNNYTASSEHLRKIIIDYVKEQNDNAWYEWYKWWWDAFDACQDSFHVAARLFAEKHWILPEVIYWNLVLILEWSHWKLLNNASQWWYVKPIWEIPREIVVLDNSEPKSESLWQRSKRIVAELRESRKSVLALLDEPINGVDRTDKKDVRKAILWMKSSVQIIAASHEDGLIDGAEESDKWIVHDLGEK